MNREDWVWMPHPGHSFCAPDCKFFLNTYVGKYIVSTIGECLPEAPIREIFAKTRGVVLEGKGDDRLADYMEKIGWEKLGGNRLYETMVFTAQAHQDSCCPWRLVDGNELGFKGYNDPSDARAGHLVMCKEWSSKKTRCKFCEDKPILKSGESVFDSNLWCPSCGIHESGRLRQVEVT